MSKTKATHYGVINEDYFSLRSPRAIDSDECTSLGEAFKAAKEMVEEYGAEKVSIVRCRYSKKHECYFEVVEAGSITIEAHGWICDDDYENDVKPDSDDVYLIS